MHESLLLYIPSNNAGKKIITKSFNILDSDLVRSRVEGSPAFSRYPGRANVPYISLENSSNRFYAKHRFGLAGTRRATHLTGPLPSTVENFFPCRYTLWLAYPGQLGQM